MENLFYDSAREASAKGDEAIDKINKESEMRKSGLSSVDLMKIAEEIESFGPLSNVAKRTGALEQWLSSPSKIEGLKQSQSAMQAPPEVFQYIYGLTSLSSCKKRIRI